MGVSPFALFLAGVLNKSIHSAFMATEQLRLFSINPYTPNVVRMIVEILLPISPTGVATRF